MSKFKREERYIVVKLKHLAVLQVAPLRNFLRENRVPALDCVVVEQDWPEYEKVWRSIERRMTGQPAEDFDRVTAERDALQQRLTAADERADVLEGLVGEVLDAVGREPLDLDAVLRLRARMRAALKPAEGVGDDTTLEEDREDFKKVFVRINTKQGQSISLADMIARYEKKPRKPNSPPTAGACWHWHN